MLKLDMDGEVIARRIDLDRYIRIIIKWMWLIVLSVGIAAGSSYVATRAMLPTFRTSLTMMVGEDASNPNLTIDQVSTSQRLADAYAGMVRRQPVLEAAVQSLGLQTTWHELQTRVLVARTPSPQIFEVRVVDSDARRAKAIADEIATQLIALSPTNDYMLQLQGRREFVKQQLDMLEASIRDAEASIAQKQAALKAETSARGVLDKQDEIQALMLNLAGWRTTYASLLTSYQGRAPNTLSVIEPAYVPTEPVGPDVKANLLMAAALGLLLALGAILFIEYIGDAVESPSDLSRVLSLSVLGTIPEIKGSQVSARLIAGRTPTDPLSEAYRALRMNIQFARHAAREVGSEKPLRAHERTGGVEEGSGGLILLVSSAGSSEGKSLTCANLATSFAQAGMRTVLVEADLRRPALQDLVGVSEGRGLTSLFLEDEAAGHAQAGWRPLELMDQRPDGTLRNGKETTALRKELTGCLVPTQTPGLYLIPSGPIPPNPAELLNSPRLEKALASLKRIVDVVVIDSPPILPVVDAVVLARKVDGVVLVARAGQTRSSMIRQARQVLLKANARVLGVVLNGERRLGLANYYHYYRPSASTGQVAADATRQGEPAPAGVAMAADD